MRVQYQTLAFKSNSLSQFSGHDPLYYLYYRPTLGSIKVRSRTAVLASFAQNERKLKFTRKGVCPERKLCNVLTCHGHVETNKLLKKRVKSFKRLYFYDIGNGNIFCND